MTRGRTVESVFHIMHAYASGDAILEIEFEGEVGTGLGPTLEFYSLVSQAFQANDLGLWRADETSTGYDGEGTETEYVFSPTGLFPAPAALVKSAVAKQGGGGGGGSSSKQAAPDSPAAPAAPSTGAGAGAAGAVAADSAAGKAKIQKRAFVTLGRLLARAILDGRRLDLPLSPAFYAWLLGRKHALSLQSMADVDPGLGRTLAQLDAVGRAYARIAADSALSAAERTAKVDALTVKGAKIEDLCLDFTLPGTTIALVPGGDELDVTLENVSDYVKRVVQYTLVDGVQVQMDAVRSGFNSVFPLQTLQIFTAEEMASLVCGNRLEPWTKEELATSLKADHGFSATSPTVERLIEVLSELDTEEQRIFLSFVTGTPSLPVGGLRALRPPLTIVRKGSNDKELPSVMTCQNYLKLPEYSSKEVLRTQLATAMHEGRGSFLLS